MGPTHGTPLGLAGLALLVACSLLRIALYPTSLPLLAGIALGALLLVAGDFARVPGTIRRTAGTLFAASAALLIVADSPLEAVERGISVGGIIGGLLAAVTVLGRSAVRSPQVKALGDYLHALRGGRRYVAVTLAAQFLAAMLSLAGIHMLLAMLRDERSLTGAERECTVLAVTRGFSAATFWSPMFGNMAILLALYPQLKWSTVLPLGLALAQVSVLVGWMLERRHVTAVGAAGALAVPHETPRAIVRTLLPLVGALTAFLVVVVTVSLLTTLRTTSAIILLAPLAAWLVNAMLTTHRPRIVAGIRELLHDTRHMPSIAPEVTLLLAAACAGSVAESAFPASWTAAIVTFLSHHHLMGIVALIGTQLVVSLVGIHPLLTAIFLATTFTPALIALPDIVHICSILAGWGLAASLTPFSVLSLMASRHSGLPLYRVSVMGNWKFATLLAAVFVVGLSGVTLYLQR